MKRNYAEEHYKRYPWKKHYNKMNQRCNNMKCDSYEYYGGKGIIADLTEEDIKELWLRDKAYLMEKPSLDRMGSDLDYVYENCRFLEMIDNIARSSKPIKQFTKEGRLLNTWQSAAEAQRCLGISRSNTCSCLKGKTKLAGGFNWEYVN